MRQKTNKNKRISRKLMRKIKNWKKKLSGLEMQKSMPFSFGDINPEEGRILTLIIMIIFTITGMVFMNVIDSRKQNQFIEPNNNSRKNIALEKEISQLVEGYPIARMTPYISQKDPKVAAFLVAIAKKESNWGKRVPILAGNDCYNYWGFRLKTDKMGSAGHTCFDSPKEAVDTVAARMDEMVNKENMNSSSDMIVWKCGYGCQDEAKSPSEQKWIRDVNFYYSKLSDYL